MAKGNNPKQPNDSGLNFEAQLWAAADKMRGHMDASEYKHVVLGLIFLKYISDAFEEKRAQLLLSFADPLGTAEVSPHIVRVFNRGGQARGLFISYSEFTEPAITTCRDALAAGAVVVRSKLQKIVELLSHKGDMKKWLKAKLTAAIADKNPMFLPPT